jgi:hypothetical protein
MTLTSLRARHNKRARIRRWAIGILFFIAGFLLSWCSR